MKNLTLALLAFVLVSCGKKEGPSAPPTPAQETTRTITQGTLVGFVADNGAHVWRGVPYGADTSGKNRWRAPRPAPAWDGTREATSFAPVCPQIATPFTPIASFVNGRLEGSEDCLTLDIYAPANAVGKNLPVMVWIHGGSNVSGSSQLYIGDQLAINENVIIVAVQYRLGPLGWFSHDALIQNAETPEDRAANFGTLDLIASLKWVRDNISTFGGDQNRVTIFGESAGGHNVTTLLASPLAEGLFHRAIIQSGSFDSTPVAEARGDTGTLMNPSSDVAGRLGGYENFHAASLQDVFAAFKLDAGGFVQLPRVIEDGITFPEGSLREAFASKDTFNDVPIITGTNRDEMKLFYLFNERLTKKILGQFYVARDQDLYDAASDYSGRVWRVRSVDQPAAMMRAADHDQVYAYRFDWDEGGKMLWMDFSKVLGAAHGLEIPFVFNRFNFSDAADPILFKKKTLKTREALSRAMGAYWASFARGGAPVHQGGPEWPIYGDDAALIYFDSTNDGGVRVKKDADSLERIIADLKVDPRVSASQKCEIAKGLGDWVPTLRPRLSSELDCQLG